MEFDNFSSNDFSFSILRVAIYWLCSSLISDIALLCLVSNVFISDLYSAIVLFLSSISFL